MKITKIKNAILEFLFSYGVAIGLFLLSQVAFYFIKGCDYELLWRIMLFIAVILLCFFYYVWRDNKKNATLIEISTPPLVEKCNEIRKYIEKNGINKPYSETIKFETALEYICNGVYEALSNKTKKSTGFERYGINILLLSGNSQSNNMGDMSLNLRKAAGFTKIRDDYSNAFNNKIKSGLCDIFKLSNNTSYHECYTQYNNGVARNLIQVYTDVKNKIKEGNYKSALNDYWEFPYDSIIVVPILPLLNHNKVTLEGFFNVISDKEPFDDDKGFTDEHKAFLEAVSGFFYDVCKNYEQQ